MTYRIATCHIVRRLRDEVGTKIIRDGGGLSPEFRLQAKKSGLTGGSLGA